MRCARLSARAGAASWSNASDRVTHDSIAGTHGESDSRLQQAGTVINAPACSVSSDGTSLAIRATAFVTRTRHSGFGRVCWRAGPNSPSHPADRGSGPGPSGGSPKRSTNRLPNAMKIARLELCPMILDHPRMELRTDRSPLGASATPLPCHAILPISLRIAGA